jgi:hypothetical protein
MPMIVGKHERTLAIDGPYIHVCFFFVLLIILFFLSFLLCVGVYQIMPTTNKGAKAVFDSGKTSSYHIDSVVSCQQSGKSSSAFRMVVLRDGGNKRYEFEAESAKIASAYHPYSIACHINRITTDRTARY